MELVTYRRDEDLAFRYTLMFQHLHKPTCPQLSQSWSRCSQTRMWPGRSCGICSTLSRSTTPRVWRRQSLSKCWTLPSTRRKTPSLGESSSSPSSCVCGREWSISRWGFRTPPPPARSCRLRTRGRRATAAAQTGWWGSPLCWIRCVEPPSSSPFPGSQCCGCFRNLI